MAIVNIGAGSGSEYGIYVGTVAPTDPSTTVWIVPDDEPPLFAYYQSNPLQTT